MNHFSKPSTPLRVAMVIHSYYPVVGGAERQVGAVAPRMVRRGLEVHVLTRRHRGLPAEETIDGVPVHRFPIPGPKPMAALFFICSAIARLLKIRPHVVHAHELFSASTVAVVAKKLLHARMVITPHSSGPRGDVQRLQGKLFGKIRMSIFRKETDAFVVISNEIKQELISAGVSPERCLMIPNGVDTETYKPLPFGQRERLRLKLGYKPADLLVVFTGRLVPLKRVQDLLAVWPGIIAQHPHARLLILGSGPEEQRLRSVAVTEVDFLGNVSHVLPYLQSADVFALPSSIEGLSVSLLEAMACGLPVLATAVGGNVDLIQHHQDGWLVPPGEQGPLEKGLNELLSHPGLREKLGQRARKKIIENYGLDQMVQRLIGLYEEIGVRI